MMEKINIKLILIIIGIIALISIGIFFAVRLINNDTGKNYTLEKIAEEDYKYFKVYSNGKYGVINTNGEKIIENKYKDVIIPNPTKAVFIAINEDGNQEILNENGEKILEEYKNIQPIEIEYTLTNLLYEKSVLKYEENSKFGIIDFNGNIISKAIYEEIKEVPYKEGEILVKKNGKYGVINNKGVELIPCKYDEIEADKYYNGMDYSKSGYIVKNTTSEGYRYGYINSKWKELLDTEYTNISRILDIQSEDAYLIASKNGRFRCYKKQRYKNKL